jgi:hypothetical protein
MSDHDALLKKVVALLDKAERTEFEAEAEAFIAKAQELITRHGIEHAVEQARLGDRSTETVETIVVKIERPYVTPKATLLGGIAIANNCRAVLSSSEEIVTVVGYPSDLAIVEMLFASLLTQAVSGMHRADPGPRPKAFRNSFLVSFASTVTRRLMEAAEASRQTYERETGTSTALVLRDRAKDVTDHLAELFPRMGKVRASSSSSAGHRAGQTAGQRADLGNKRVGARKALR